MSYHIYRTEGIILGSNLAGESNHFFNVYTKDLGLIGVWGQGTRKLESKLRFNMQDLSHVRIQMVRGKKMWRLTDVENVATFSNLRASSQKRMVAGQIALLLKRLLEEGTEPQVYDLFVDAMNQLDKTDHVEEKLRAFELLFVLRMLYHLGYGKDTVPEEMVDSLVWDDVVLERVVRNKVVLTKIANTSLQHTHM